MVQMITGISAPAPVWALCQIEGKIYSVPTAYYSMALMCRRDIFAQAGVPLRTPEDWDEFYRFARRLTRLPSKEPEASPGDPRVYGLYILANKDVGHRLMQYIWSAGGEVVRSIGALDYVYHKPLYWLYERALALRR